MIFKTPRVAVIGAGLSGIVSARHLKSSGIEVVVYERSSQAGGNWVYDERKSPEPRYPSVNPSEAELLGESITDDQRAELNGHCEMGIAKLAHAPPGPAYDGLMTNVPTYLQELKGHPWPEVDEPFVNVRVCGEYLQSYSRKFGVDEVTRYDTKVERLEKRGAKWRVEARTLIARSGEFVDSFDEFDRVVVANGHYHASKVPAIPGLAEWKKAFPSKVQHSKSYRRPDEFKDQTVLLIGAGVSSTDIARELSSIAKTIYQSSRDSPYDLPVELLPPNASRVAELSSFPTPGIANLKDNTTISGINKVILCTGYHFSLPFLPSYHNDTLPPEQANGEVLVTNGTQIHNLHRDIFYIPDPTLAFVGIPFYTATFSFFEYQAIALAAVVSGRARLPCQTEMRKEYEERVRRKGFGRSFHDMKGEEVGYVREIVEWVNGDAEVTGGGRVEGHSGEWLERRERSRETFLKFLVERERRERERVVLRSVEEVCQI